MKNNSQKLIKNWIADTGWSVPSQLFVCCDFIDTLPKNLFKKFENYIKERANKEIGEETKSYSDELLKR